MLWTKCRWERFPTPRTRSKPWLPTRNQFLYCLSSD